LVQKALASRVPILAAVGAPSSLAADLARDANMALLGFVRAGRFKIYSGPQRIRAAA
jgi:FdhD protein